MKKIIFLDFDGVLNTEYNQNLLMYHGKSWKDKYGAFFDPETVAELKRTESLRFLTDKGLSFTADFKKLQNPTIEWHQYRTFP